MRYLCTICDLYFSAAAPREAFRHISLEHANDSKAVRDRLTAIFEEQLKTSFGCAQTTPLKTGASATDPDIRHIVVRRKP